MNIRAKPALTAALVVLGLCSCAPIDVKEMHMIAAVDLTASTTGTLPLQHWCLRGEGWTHNYLLYAETHAQVWVTEGTCDVTGPHFAIESLLLEWRYKGGQLETRHCTNTSTCNYDNRDYGITRDLECIAGKAKNVNYTAAITSDRLACP